jgi:hypothetical protein
MYIVSVISIYIAFLLSSKAIKELEGRKRVSKEGRKKESKEVQIRSMPLSPLGK